MITYFPKALMCMRTLPPDGTAKTTTGMTSGLLATATVLAAFRILIPRTFSVSLQIYGYNCDCDVNPFPDYKSAVEWIQQQIDSNNDYKYDDTRFWVDVVAI